MTIDKELDGYLKKQNVTKKQRQELIKVFLTMTPEQQDETLEFERNKVSLLSVKVPSEFEEHVEFVDQFRRLYPGVELIYIHNGGSRTPKERQDQIVLGLLPGASDLLCLEYKLSIEMKRSKGGRQSQAQKEFEDYCKKIGWTYILALGAKDGLEKVKLAINKFSSH